MSQTLLCRVCFWSAEITRTESKVWCSHATWHGWHDKVACNGAGFKSDPRPPSVRLTDRSAVR